ncbi:MAG: B12-binding domain-containing radical SAM protein [Spirochaetales bacterium]|nr:B12-binding domain-containing radical SAM protein [Spirochaetales bacterium]
MNIGLISIVPETVPVTSHSLIVLKNFGKLKKHKHSITIKKFFCENDKNEILNRILSGNFEIIGFSSYLWNSKLIKWLAAKIKEINKNIFIIVGGIQLSTEPEKTLLENPGIDIVIQGEGEIPFYNVIDNLASKKYCFQDIKNVCFRDENGDIKRNSKDDLMKLDDINYTLTMDNEDELEIVSYESFRGCIWSCRYCAWGELNKVRFYSEEKVMADLEYIFSLPKLRTLAFVDSNFFIYKKRALKFLKYMNSLNEKRKQERYPLIFPYFETNAESLDDDLIDELLKFPYDFKEGKFLKFGLQSSDKDTLKESNRRFNLEKFKSNYNKIINKGLKEVSVEIICGLPGDTLEKYKKTLDFLISDLNVEYFQSYFFSIVPGSYFWYHAGDYGLEFEKEAPHNIIQSNSFSKEDLCEADKLSYYLQLIYQSMKRIKRFVDKKVEKDKMKLYEKIIDFIYNNYKEYFCPSRHCSDNSIGKDLRRMVTPEYQKIKMDIINGAIDIIKNYNE